jgi:CheY-like chemotaxis protein
MMIDCYRILIAHDAPMFQSFLERLIQVCYPSATVIRCAHGVAALRAYERAGADLLLTDFHMPQMDGPTLIRTLRSRQVTIPIIGLSGEPLNEHEFRQAGADGFLHPPFSVSDFQKVVHALLPP